MHKQAQDPGEGAPTSAPPATPRVSGESAKLAEPSETPLPESNTRPATSAEGAEPEPTDTLLSAGKPADRLELMLEDGLARLDGRVRELDARLAVLEQKKTSAAPEPRPSPWLWLAFLVALVIVFQMLQRVR